MKNKKILIFLNEVSRGKVGANRSILDAKQSILAAGVVPEYRKILSPLSVTYDIASVKPDAVIFNGLASLDTLFGPAALTEAILQHRNIFIYWHESKWVFDRLKSTKPFKSSIIYSLVKNPAIKHLAVSRKTQNDLIENLNIAPSKIRIIHECVLPPSDDEKKLSLLYNRNNNHKAVLGIGSIQPRKGVHIFCEAAAKVLKTNPDTMFFWLGEAFPKYRKYEKYCNEIILKTGIDESFYFKGHLDPPFDYINAADILVIPSLDDPMPLTGIEAMARGKHVLTFNNGGMAEVLQDTGDVIMESTPAALAARIIEVLNTQQINTIYLDNIKRYNDLFTPGQFAKKLLSAVM